MSTTVTINPVVSVCAATVAGIGALLGAVLIDDADCQRMLEQVRQDERAQRFASISLRSSDLARLAQGAREAQFSVRETKDWLRIDVPGQRDPVWATRTQEGIAIAGGARTIEQVSVANTVSRLTQMLASRGATVARVPARAGGRDVEFVATAADNRQLLIDVKPSGEAVVDAVNHRGPECETVARDLAAAMEGEITSFSRKPDYFGGVSARVRSRQNA